MEQTDRELKDRKEKFKREMKEILHQSIIVFKDDMDKFEYLQMEKIRPIKRKWLDWLINPNVMGKKPEIIRNISRFFETKKKKKKKKHNGRINNNRIKKKKLQKRKNTVKDQLRMEE